MFKITLTEDGISEHLKKNIEKVQPIMEKLIRENSGLVQQEIKSQVLNGGKGLPVRTGETQSKGFEWIQHTKKKKGVPIVDGYFWSRISNLYENFKNRKRIYLTRLTKKVFENNTQGENNFERAIEEFSKD